MLQMYESLIIINYFILLSTISWKAFDKYTATLKHARIWSGDKTGIMNWIVELVEKRRVNRKTGKPKNRPLTLLCYLQTHNLFLGFGNIPQPDVVEFVLRVFFYSRLQTSTPQKKKNVYLELNNRTLTSRDIYTSPKDYGWTNIWRTM